MNHPKFDAEGTCNICHDYFCDRCLFEAESIVLCKSHMRTYYAITWTPLFSFWSTEDNFENSIIFINQKNRAYKKLGIPIVLKTDYELGMNNQIITCYTFFTDVNYLNKALSWINKY